MPTGTNPEGGWATPFVPIDAAMVAESGLAIAECPPNGVRQVLHAMAGAGVSVPQ